MSIVSKLMSAIRRDGDPKLAAAVAKPVEPAYVVPTVKFDPKLVTEAIKADLIKNIRNIKEIGESHFDRVYDAALRSISGGHDLAMLFNAIMELNLPGMTKRRASEIPTSLNCKATALINRDRRVSLGIEYAVWMYIGAPCQMNPKKPSPEDIRQDAAHKAVDGKRYEVAKGMLLNGRLTMPGWDDGCKCTSRPIIPGFD